MLGEVTAAHCSLKDHVMFASNRKRSPIIESAEHLASGENPCRAFGYQPKGRKDPFGRRGIRPSFLGVFWHDGSKALF